MSIGTMSLPRLLALLVLPAAGCARHDSVRDEQPARFGAHRPPPKPGSSITHSKMCSCRSCLPRSCCDGSAEPELPAGCAESGASLDPADCVLRVQSCEPRCSERVFRVRSNQSCDERRPAECCSS